MKRASAETRAARALASEARLMGAELVMGRLRSFGFDANICPNGVEVLRVMVYADRFDEDTSTTARVIVAFPTRELALAAVVLDMLKAEAPPWLLRGETLTFEGPMVGRVGLQLTLRKAWFA